MAVNGDAAMNPNESELESVFECREESEAWAVQGLLQSAGIEAVVHSLEAPQDVLPGVGNLSVRVPAKQATDARQIVESYQSNPPREDEMQLSDDGAAGPGPATKIPSPS